MISLIPWSLRKLWLRYVLVMAFKHADEAASHVKVHEIEILQGA